MDGDHGCGRCIMPAAREVMMAKLPTRSPTHDDVPLARLAAMGLELEDIADGDAVALPALVELAEDRGRPASHYLAAVALATELRVTPPAPVTVRVCAGTCQRWGALDVLDHLVGHLVAQRAGPAAASAAPRFAIAPVSCLDRCDQAPACEIHGAHGQLVVAPATRSALDEALRALAD
ncbi:MAG: (2Fe-2S) ferredoxin domain-containing protein [Deltaproteobacteria bacterium]|nr:MAG: (2Fe-2S) ferredoxin domain-containing protein [Deltaproteobacteria bacterium]